MKINYHLRDIYDKAVDIIHSPIIPSVGDELFITKEEIDGVYEVIKRQINILDDSNIVLTVRKLR